MAAGRSLQWAEKADRYAEPGTIERGWADYAAGRASSACEGHQTEGVAAAPACPEQAQDAR